MTLLAPLLGLQSVQAAPPLDQLAAQQCQTYVGVRVGNLLSVSVEQVRALPRVQQWLVTGQVRRQRQVDLHFVCRLSHPAKEWRLEQLELLQLQQAGNPPAAPRPLNPG